MCGIAGFQGEGNLDVLGRMMDALRHRGPDGEGTYRDETAAIFLGHRRLAVIDIATGSQPMANDDGSTVIVFNGEIYNHRALRVELEGVGQRFASHHSDTEVIIRGYDAWGLDIIDKLDGMFAFALYDKARGRLILARDRFGEKPLFYCAMEGGLAFASELQSLRCYPAAQRASLDSAALQKLFAYSFLPGEVTPYRGISKLLPGSVLIYDVAGRTIDRKRYWRFTLTPDNPPDGSEADWIETLRSLLRQAVASRLESDVPLGVFLSGGIDSSAIAALAADVAGADRVSTFTIGFDEASFDESAFASLAAGAIGSRHTVEVCRAHYLKENVARVLGANSDLLGDPSLVPTYLLAEATRKHVTVALSGDGSDELFGGYEPFKILRKAHLYQSLMPRPVHAAIRMLWARLPASDQYLALDFKVGRALRGLSFNQNIWNPVWLAALSPCEIKDAFEAPLALEDLYSEAIEEWERAPNLDLIDRTLHFFTNLYLPDDILVKSDRAGMQHALEVRAPFLARSIADFASRLPHQVKVRRGSGKWILKQAMAGIVPDEILGRRKKGFGIPVQSWLREMGARDWHPTPSVRNSAFDSWQREHLARTSDHRGALWCRLVIDAALRRDAA